jgi:hypothetical protein
LISLDSVAVGNFEQCEVRIGRLDEQVGLGNTVHILKLRHRRILEGQERETGQASENAHKIPAGGRPSLPGRVATIRVA